LHPVLIAEDSVADFFLANRAFARALSPVSCFMPMTARMPSLIFKAKRLIAIENDIHFRACL
jgi:hypothetical protein